MLQKRNFTYSSSLEEDEDEEDEEEDDDELEDFLDFLEISAGEGCTTALEDLLLEGPDRLELREFKDEVLASIWLREPWDPPLDPLLIHAVPFPFPVNRNLTDNRRNNM